MPTLATTYSSKIFHKNVDNFVHKLSKNAKKNIIHNLAQTINITTHNTRQSTKLC